MATNNASNQQVTNNADGFDTSGGTTKRKLTITGADVTLTGSGTSVLTAPSGTDTLVGRASTDTITGTKTFNSGTVILAGSTSGGTTIVPTAAASGTLTLPAATDTVAVLATAQALTNKTYNGLTVTSSTGTLTVPNTVVLTGPAASGTAMTLGNTETVTGVKTFGSAGAVGRLKVAGTTSGSTVLDATAVASGTLTLPAATDTLVGKATTDVLTNKDLSSRTNIIPVGAVVQEVDTSSSAVATGTTLLPYDDTIPQNTEGDQYMSLTITPIATTNRLFIEAELFLSNSAGVQDLSAALFQDTTANALAAANTTLAAATYSAKIRITHTMTAATTSATTFKIRAGGSVAGTTTFNGQSGLRRFGGITLSTIRITEYKV